MLPFLVAPTSSLTQERLTLPRDHSFGCLDGLLAEKPCESVITATIQCLPFLVPMYSLKNSDNKNYRYSKIRRGNEDLLITSIEFNTSRETLSITNTVEHNLWLHLAVKDQRENSFYVQEIPLLLGS